MEKKLVRSVARRLGANQPLGTVHMSVFVPSVDRTGKRLKGTDWVCETLQTLGRLFRGGTAYPKGRGVWRDDEAGGKLVFDDTTIVFSYVSSGDLTARSLRELKRFLHRLGRETNQGEVGLVVDGCYVGITDFEEPA